MQTGTKETRITNAAHSNAPIPSSETGLFVFDDLRLRGWALAQSDGLTYANDFAVAFNASSEIVRVRTLSSHALEIKYATIADTLTWSANAVTITSKSGYGVAMYANGNAIDVFYMDSTGAVIKKITSADGGHTFGAASTVKTLANTPTNSFPRLAAPASNILFYTDSEGTTISGTVVYSTVYSGGAWQTSVAWDLGQAAMGMGKAMTLPSGAAYPSTLAVQSLGSDNYLLVFYAEKFRGSYIDGLYCVRVNNLAASQTAIWEQPQMIWAASAPSTVLNQNSDAYYAAFPKIQQVGSEYWISALEVSAFAGNAASHLVCFRSTDGRHWTDRQDLNTIASTALTYTNAGNVSFTTADLIFAQVLVSVNRTFIVGFDKTFLAASTTLVGITNTAKQTGATGTLKWRSWDIDFPSGGEAATGSLELNNSDGAYTSNANIIAGSRLTVKAGYYTALPGNESVTILTGIVNHVQRYVSRAGGLVHLIRISFRDNLYKLANWIADIYYEYTSGEQLFVNAFPDTSAVRILNGSFSSVGDELWSGAIDSTIRAADNLGALATSTRVRDGALETKFRCLDTSTAAYASDQYAGIAFQVQDEQNYWAVFYNKDADSKFTLRQASPSSGNKNVSYSAVVGSASAAVAFKTNTYYWLRAQQYHNRIVAWYASAIMPPEGLGAAAGSAGGSLVNGTPYYYVIEAVDAITSERSIQSVQVAFTATATGKIVLTWTKSGGANAYKIYRSTTTGSYGASSLLTTTGDVATYTDTGTGLSAGTPQITSIDQRHGWTKVIDYTGVPTNLGNWGIIGTGSLSPLSGYNMGYNGARNWQVDMVLWNSDTPSTPLNRVDWAEAFKVPKTCYLSSISVVMAVASSTQPSVIIGILANDTASGFPKSAATIANIIWQTNVASADLLGNTTIAPPGKAFTVNVGSQITLVPNTTYWIWIAPAGDAAATGGAKWFGYKDTSPFPLWTANPVVTSHDDGATWAVDYTDGRTCMAAWVTVRWESRGIVFNKINFCAGEKLQAVEDIATDIATKAGVMTTVPSSFLTDAFGAALDADADGTDHNWCSTDTGTWATSSGVLTGYAASGTTYGILRSNSYRGTMGDLILYSKLKLLAASQKAGLAFNLGSSVDATNCTGYFVEFDNSAQVVNVYACNAQAISADTRIAQFPSIITIPTNVTFDVALFWQAGFLYVYINNVFIGKCLASQVATTSGYVGAWCYGQNGGGAVANWDDFRLPDIQSVKDYFVVASDSDGKSALANLMGEFDAKFQMRYDGALVISRFMNRAQVDAYSARVKNLEYDSDFDNWASDIQPSGTNWARRIIGYLLDRFGRRYKKMDYANEARTDKQAYDKGAVPARVMEERADQIKLASAAVLTAEREDRVSITCLEDSTVSDAILDNMHWSQPDPFHIEQTANFRKFVS